MDRMGKDPQIELYERELADGSTNMTFDLWCFSKELSKLLEQRSE